MGSRNLGSSRSQNNLHKPGYLVDLATIGNGGRKKSGYTNGGYNFGAQG